MSKNTPSGDAHATENDAQLPAECLERQFDVIDSADGSVVAFLVVNARKDISPLLEALTRQVNSHAPLRPSGNWPWFELFLARPNINSPFIALTELDNCLYLSTRFSNTFTGVACIDLTDWVDDFDSDEFCRLVGGLDRYPDTVFAFSMHTDFDADIKKAERALSKTMAIATITDPSWQPTVKARIIGFGSSENARD